MACICHRCWTACTQRKSLVALAKLDLIHEMFDEDIIDFIYEGNKLYAHQQNRHNFQLKRFEEILGLVPLELRRLHFDLIQYYKIFNNMTSLNQSDYFTHHHPSSFSRKQESFLIKPFNKPNYLLTSFFYRSVDCWNSLPLSVKNSTSLHTFKTKLLTVDLSLYLIGSAFV